jgi:2-polyprenyl-3-methyl-5-hydroxy-6-metoxy-1,4-benzoquinol methylase
VSAVTSTVEPLPFAPRACPLCDSLERHLVFPQRFERLSSGSLMAGYDVVICDRCGLGFADRIPTQAEFDTYYRQMSKYENQHQGGAPAAYLEATYESIARFVSAAVPDRGARLLDVGCATGALLAAFKRLGYTDLLGLDPSPVCARSAAELYGIEVRAQTIADLADSTERFDCVMLSSVLEHVHDARESVSQLVNLLRPGGMLFIEVPDATRFAKHLSAPYQQFSMEHINFFTPRTLASLCETAGMELIALEQPIRILDTAEEPAITAMFGRARASAVSVPTTPTTDSSLRTYVEESRLLDEQVRSRIEALQTSDEKFLVWGAGTHTLRLLASQILRTEHVEAFIDSNPRYQDKLLAGVPVRSPGALDQLEAPIVISSRVFQEEIVRTLRDELHYQGEVVTLY